MKKIKALRKEKKLTQTALAGSELTKSMLSQIENGKSYTFYENITIYCGKNLNVKRAFLLEEDEEEIVELIQKNGAINKIK